jgi:hypothetical protein
MVSRYPYRNVNWRDESRTWEWSTKYAEWMSLAESHRNHRFTALERNLCQNNRTENASLFAILTGRASPSTE